jgi:hypothetical protein
LTIAAMRPPPRGLLRKELRSLVVAAELEEIFFTEVAPESEHIRNKIFADCFLLFMPAKPIPATRGYCQA